MRLGAKTLFSPASLVAFKDFRRIQKFSSIIPRKKLINFKFFDKLDN